MLLSNLGKYRIIKWLGGGQFGDVYLAFDTILEKEFALKVARMRSEDILMLKDEARLLATLDHKNIVRFYNVDNINGNFIMVLEYINGRSLRAILKENKIDLSRAIKIITQCLEGLNYAHNKNILHRDLKPENIILAELDTVKITDFGLAKFIRPGSISASIAGTPIYMAPEAWQGTFLPQSDIYSIGAILYEILTGKPPFLAETLEKIRSAVLKKNPFAPSILNPDIPGWLEKIINDSLSKDPKKRIKTAQDFLLLLNKATNSIRVISTATAPMTEDKMQLSSQQSEIINSNANKILVLGGAGTGKTTTLIYKVYATIKYCCFEPDSILIVTFTKKAAKDIETRLEKLLGYRVKDLWLGTLHTIAYRILKKEAPFIDFSEDFEILEESKEVLKAFAPKLSYQKLNLITKQIECWKTELISPKTAEQNSENEWQKACANIYQKYQEYLKANNLMDFDDLIYYTVKLLKNSDLLKIYASKFNWVFVDELQDLNPAQYQIIRLLSSYHNRIFLTGDEDQSIYEWRGAHPEYVFEVSKNFPNIQTFLLTQNFRIPAGIWRLASNLISKNKGHKSKPIVLLKDEIKNVELISSDNEFDEVYFITKIIKQLVEQENKAFSDIAILYRLNSQSRIYEEGMSKERIPYSVIGDERFYERDEVKYLVDLLKAIQKKDLNAALPTIAWLLNIKSENLRLNNHKFQLKNKIKNSAITKFLASLELIFNEELKLTIAELLELIIKQSGYLDRLNDEASSTAYKRIQNIQELLQSAKDFSFSELNLFLNHLLLLENLELVDWGKNTVKLLTVHSAKGLEFPVVFLVGLIEGIFPLTKNLNSTKTLAEERRICFVAITRALERLFISYPKRFRSRLVEPSRFIAEMLGM